MSSSKALSTLGDRPAHLKIRAPPDQMKNRQYLLDEIADLNRRLNHLPILEATVEALTLTCHQKGRITLLVCRTCHPPRCTTRDHFLASFRPGV